MDHTALTNGPGVAVKVLTLQEIPSRNHTQPEDLEAFKSGMYSGIQVARASLPRRHPGNRYTSASTSRSVTRASKLIESNFLPPVCFSICSLV